MSIKVMYTDLDGTMVGPGGCFVRDSDGALTMEPTRALVQLLDAGIKLVLVSGRTRAQLQEACRIFGAEGFIAEMGAIIGWDFGRRSSVLSGQAPPDFGGPLVEQLESVGLVDALMARYEGRITHHAPWHLGHETDVMLHGQVDVDDVEKWLTSEGYDWLTFVDNGRLSGRPMPELDGPVHVYHLMARGLSKGRGIEVDLERRGLTRDDAIAVGDSLSDLDMAGYVKQMFVVSGGAATPSISTAAQGLSNVTACDGDVGLGWAQAARWAVTHRDS